ncbi:MAG: ABC transporter permease, partial [Saprospiraceae bacterium]|nr:ABC transporter permease [Saprospiraceae bacterium]
MFRNYFKIALRQLFKQKFFSLINIAGLALSVACCLLIGLFVKNELSYDTYHQHSNEIYRLALDINLNQSIAKGTALPAPAATTIKEEFPEVVNACRLNRFFFNAGTNLVRTPNDNESTFQEKFVYVDHSFTEMFDFTTVFGDPESWLLEPYSIVITKRVADQFFPHLDPVGEQLILNDDTENQAYRITGVIEEMPSNSHLDFEYLMSMSTLDASQANNWVNNNYFSYVQLAPGTDPEKLNAKLIPFGLKYFGPQFREQLKVDLEQVTKTGSKYNLFLQPLADVHLRS